MLEHDGSLSRPDAFFGARQDVFNATVFEQARRWWTEPLIQPKHMAHAKVARQLESAAFNPTYRFTATVESFSLGEMAAPFVAFGDLDAATVNRTLVEYFFREYLFFLSFFLFLFFLATLRGTLVSVVSGSLTVASLSPTHRKRAAADRAGLAHPGRGGQARSNSARLEHDR